MTYRVEVSRKAGRFINGLERKDKARVLAVLDLLADNPRPATCIALQGDPAGRYRIRVGNYRVIYRVFDDRLVVDVIQVGHRRDVYR